MNKNELSLKLSRKIGDAIEAFGSDGDVFTSDNRSDYITAAVSKAFMLLKKIVTVEELNSIFPDLFKRSNVSVTKSTNYPLSNYDIYESTDFNASDFEIEEMFYVSSGVMKSVASKKSNKLYSYIFSSDPLEVEDFFVVNDNKLVVAVKKGNAVDDNSLAVTKKRKNCVVNSDNFDIDSSYEKLVLAIASKEAMEDIARADKYQLYNNEITETINMITQKTQLNRQEEGRYREE